MNVSIGLKHIYFGKRETMLNQPSIPQGKAAACGAELVRMWHVDMDERYNITRRSDREHFLVVRTLDGHGKIWLDSVGELDLLPDTFLLIRNTDFYHYCCVPPRWHFWWMEFRFDCPEALPLGKSIKLMREVSEDGVLEEIFNNLMSGERELRDYACACFNMLLHRWLAGHKKKYSKPHQEVIERIAGMMQKRVAENWTVRQMAEEANMSERGFRSAFTSVMGQGPKKYYDSLRLRIGREMLRQGLYNIYEVANRLAFSNPFHFSKAYKRQFGVPPSEDKV